MSFRVRMILGVAAIEAVLLALLAFTNLHNLRNSNVESVERRMAVANRLLYASLHDAIIASDLATVTELVTNVVDTGDISFVRVVDGNGAEMAHAGAVPARPATHQKRFDLDHDDSFEQVLPVSIAGENFGRIEFGVDVRPLRAVVDRARNASLAISAVGMALVALFAWVIGGFLSRHLLQLRDVSRRLAEGRYDVRMPVQGQDELADTARAFNRMADQLQSNHDELERLVHERTAALEGAVHQLEDRNKVLAQLNGALATAKVAAESATVAKSAFLANMSHEIRTPLNAITGMAYLIRHGGLTPRQSDQLDKLETAGKHLLGIINAVLELSKIEAGKFVLDESAVSVHALLGNIMSMLRERAQAKQLQLSTHIGSLPHDLRGDATRL
ncbi:MAG: hypothetical protein RJA44_1931, partial [Pseudomonadota bacterium]